MCNTHKANKTIDLTTFPFLKTKKRIAVLLNQYLEKSKKREVEVLKQEQPEYIAEQLQLNSILKNGFQNLDNLEKFVNTYLKHTIHLSNPKYMGHQVAVPQDLSGIPDWIHGTINNPSSLYEMGPAGATLEGFMINWMLSKLNWFKGKNFYDFKFSHT